MAGVPRGRVTQNLVRVNGQVAEVGDSFHLRRLINIAPGIDPNDAIIKDQFDPVDKRTQFRLISSSGSITLSDAGSPLNGMMVPNYYNYIGELPDGRKCGISLLYDPTITKLSGNVYTNWVASESVVFAIAGQSGSYNVNINPLTTHAGAEYFEWNSAPADFAPFFQITVAYFQRSCHSHLSPLFPSHPFFLPSFPFPFLLLLGVPKNALQALRRW